MGLRRSSVGVWWRGSTPWPTRSGAVQNALFESDSDLAEEIAALQELGIDTTAQDLRMGSPSERIMHRAHPVLVSLTANKVPAG